MKKKKRKPQGSSAGLLVGIAAILGVLVVGGGLSAYFFMRNPDGNANQQAKADEKDKAKSEKPFRIAPRIDEGSPTKKGGTGIIQNTRGAVYRTERQSELRQIGLSYQQFYDEYKGAARTYENFLEYIKTFGPIHEAIKDGYYQMNMNARLDGQSIICYERDKDFQGYRSVFGNGEIRCVPEAEWKIALGK